MPPPTRASAPSPTQRPVRDLRANEGTTPSSSSDARRGRPFGMAGATRRAAGECAGVGTETETGTGIGRAAWAGGSPPSTITDSFGSADTVGFGGGCDPFVDCCTSAFTSARASFAWSVRISLGVMLEGPANGASSSCHDGRNDVARRSKSSAVSSVEAKAERSFPLESDGSPGYDMTVPSLPPR